MEQEPVFAVVLDEPVPSERLPGVAAALSGATGGDVSRIEARLAKGGTLARAISLERAEHIAGMLRSAGLRVRIEEPQSEFAWNADVDRTPEPVVAQSPTARTQTTERSTPNAALVGAIICLGLGGLIAYYAPLLLIVFGPLFIAAFALAIVAIAQRSIAAGTIVLIATMIVGPFMAIGNLARMFSPPATTLSTPAPSSTPRATGQDPVSGVAGSSIAGAQEDVAAADTSTSGIAYLSSVDLYDLEAREISTVLRDDVVGVRFKLRNTGDRTVKRLQVTVYFRDSNDVVVFQEEFTPVTDNAFISDRDVLRPNHIFQLPTDRFFTLDRVPTEWQPGNVIAEISLIELQ